VGRSEVRKTFGERMAAVRFGAAKKGTMNRAPTKSGFVAGSTIRVPRG
jgi:hypothetical protein